MARTYHHKDTAGQKRKPVRATATVLYLYAISRMPARNPPKISAEAIDDSSRVEALPCEDYLCWISRVPKADFADHLSERMQDLQWLATASLRHQRVVAEVASQAAALPARFGTVFLGEASLAWHLKQHRRALNGAFKRVAGADEWGIKVFALAAPQKPVTAGPRSGSEYLKRKAELLAPRAGRKLDPQVEEFVARLKRLAVAVSTGGKASAGQPGLLWHGSFLIRRKDRGKLNSVLRKYTTQWKEVRRVDCSGPWPPYSFVGEHAR
ncbi:MAG TPA: GvpL/GvpF family gas vesicle protein [Terriglobales bacterium]|nr:GvpL/GvpF family gas vesicle protein [Terriglobales bacterium]